MVQTPIEIKLELTKQEINTIIAHLVEGQYKIVNSIIFKIDKQVKEQITPTKLEESKSDV